MMYSTKTPSWRREIGFGMLAIAAVVSASVAGMRAAALEDYRARPREVLLPGLRGDYRGAGAFAFMLSVSPQPDLNC